MKHRGLTAVLGLVLALVFSTCSTDEQTGPSPGVGKLTGVVRDAVTQALLSGVTVQGDSPAETQVATTGSDGSYALSFSLDSSATVRVSLQKSGYRDSLFYINVKSGVTIGPLQNRLWSALPQGPAVLSGQVKDLLSGSVLPGVVLLAQSLVLDPRNATTDAQGRFQMSFPVDSAFKGTSANLDLLIKHAGYRDTTIGVTVQFGTVTQTQIRLIPKTAALVLGTVVDASTKAPISAVTVQGVVAQGGSGGSNTTSDLLGSYQLTFAVDTTAIVQLSFAKVGYRDTVFYVRLQPSTSTQVNPLLSRGFTGGGGGSGLAQTIAFLGASPSEISVYGVGGKETSVLDWEVRDSLGQPIDGNHSVNLTFQILNGPGGGEYLSPVTMTTTPVGRASVTLNAGTRSGIVQVVATAVVGGRTIISSPVKVTINGGFPVQARFSIAAERFNFPALQWLGRTDKISILAGDVYSNPVATGTAIYFRSSAGVIQPTVFTDKNGQGTVELISGNPIPRGGYGAPGLADSMYHYVVAKTIGQGGVTVQDSVLLLWSGSSLIWNAPTTFAIDSGGSQTFNFRVSDQYYHPLSAGTTISISAKVPPPPSPDVVVNQVNLAFGLNGSVTLSDVISRGLGSTDFSFTLSDGTSNVTILTSVVVTISVSSPNGNAVYTISGTVR